MEIIDVPEFAQLPRHRLRVRRWLMASGFYAVGVPFVLYGHQVGQMEAFESWLFVGMAVLGNVLLGVIFFTRSNENFADPSLTLPQMILAIVATLVFAAGASDGLRPTISLGLLAPLIFGCFQLRPLQLLRLALGAMAGYGLMLASVWLSRGLERPVVELTHWMGLNLMLIAFVAICSDIARMRDRQRELSQRLQESADRDMLTGLYNRRGMIRLVPAMIELAVRHQRPFSVCMVDLDRFKQINDRFGHQAGDTALQWVTVRMRPLLRQSDAMVRIGGEEFLLVLPETSHAGAVELMERIRMHLANSRLEYPGADPLQITISAGVATLRPDEDLDDLIARADEALYAAKREGRNRTVGEAA
jgi:diguanylate cyclase (GGDEF)-like protein